MIQNHTKVNFLSLLQIKKMPSPLNITSKQAELTNFKLNKTGYFIALSLMYLVILIPITAFILIISSGAKPAFGLIVFSVAMGFGAYFFYRLAAWNKHGKEKYILENSVFIYQPEAKNISYKKFEFDIEQLIISIVDSEISAEYDGMKQGIAWLRLSDGKTTIQTNIKTPRSLILDLMKTFDDWGIVTEGNFENLRD